MKVILITGLTALAFPAAGQTDAATYRDCEHTTLVSRELANAHSDAILTGRVQSDTTANAFNGLVIDQASGRKISGANIMFTQGTYIFLATTNSKGEFHLMRNEFRGKWDIRIQHPDYACLELAAVEMGGGMDATLKLHRK